MSYHNFLNNDTGNSYGSFEVFYAELGVNDEYNSPGWYWWACFPGCLPDGDPVGPFDTENEAILDAKETD